MAVVNISLPDQMKEYVDERVLEGRFSTTSEYFRDLVRVDQDARAQSRLEALMIQGIESGAGPQITEDYIAEKRAKLIEKYSKNPS